MSYKKYAENSVFTRVFKMIKYVTNYRLVHKRNFTAKSKGEQYDYQKGKAIQYVSLTCGAEKIYSILQYRISTK